MDLIFEFYINVLFFFVLQQNSKNNANFINMNSASLKLAEFVDQ